MKSTKRTISIDLTFEGDGRIEERPAGVFRGGVPDPTLSTSCGMNILPEFEDDEGVRGPAVEGGSYVGDLQVNVWGTTADFRELGRHLLAIAELDTSVDPDFHQHYDMLRSDDGQTRVHLILRKVRE